MSSQPLLTLSLPEALQKLFGDEERIVVLTVTPDGKLLNFTVQPLAEVVAMLDLHGFGQPVLSP